MAGDGDVWLRGSGARPLDASDPRWIDNIHLLGTLGQGGFGRVYLGVLKGRYVAVKQLLAEDSELTSDPDFLRRFDREVQNLSRLSEGTSAALLDKDTQAKPPWIATAYVPGVTLRDAVKGGDMVRAGGPLAAEALWWLLRDLAAELDGVHGWGLVHRDISPSNVMLTRDTAVLIDFGIARAHGQSRLTPKDRILGNPPFMSPEQANGELELTGASDLFSLGSVIVYAATGRSPFAGGTSDVVLDLVRRAAPDLSQLRSIDPDLVSVVAACMAKAPGQRPSAEELASWAQRRCRGGEAPWPRSVREHVAERAAFAATTPPVPEDQTVPTPAPPEDGNGSGATPQPDTKLLTKALRRGHGKERPRSPQRRWKAITLVMSLLILAGGGGVAYQLLPIHEPAPPSAAPRAADSPTPTAVDTPTTSPKPQKSPSSAKPSGRATSGSEPRESEPRETEGGARVNGGSGGSVQRTPGAPPTTYSQSGETVTLRWQAPAANGSSITDYRIVWYGSDINGGSGDAILSASRDEYVYKIRWFNSGNTYRVTVEAKNASGWGAKTTLYIRPD